MRALSPQAGHTFCQKKYTTIKHKNTKKEKNKKNANQARRAYAKYKGSRHFQGRGRSQSTTPSKNLTAGNKKVEKRQATPRSSNAFAPVHSPTRRNLLPLYPPSRKKPSRCPRTQRVFSPSSPASSPTHPLLPLRMHARSFCLLQRKEFGVLVRT